MQKYIKKVEDAREFAQHPIYDEAETIEQELAALDYIEGQSLKALNEIGSEIEEVRDGLKLISEDLRKVCPLILKYKSKPFVVSGSDKFHTISLAEKLDNIIDDLRGLANGNSI